jgi:hypothetical protein
MKCKTFFYKRCWRHLRAAFGHCKFLPAFEDGIEAVQASLKISKEILWIF